MICLKNPIRFIINGLVLSLVSLALRAVSVIFGARINNILGSGEVGLYSLVGSVMAPAIALASVGVNLAVSTLIAQEQGKGRSDAALGVLIASIKYALFVSLSVGGLVFLLARPISSLLLDSPHAAIQIRILSLGIPAISISAATSGYFTAVRRTSKNAILQLCEQLFRVSITLFTLNKLSGKGSAICLSAMLACSVLSDILSCLCSLLLCKHDAVKHRKKRLSAGDSVLKRIIKITLPVSVSSSLRSGLTTLEHILIPKGLRKSGASPESALSSYGILGGMAMPIIFFPASFLYSYSGLLIPELAEAKQRDRKDLIFDICKSTVKYVTLFSVIASAVIFCFSDGISLAIYKNNEASLHIATLSLLIPIMYLDTAVDSLLKGLGEQVWTMKVNIADSLLSIFGVWFLVPRLGLEGYIILLFISELINFSLSLYRLVRVTGASLGLIRNLVISWPLSLISAFSVKLTAELLFIKVTGGFIFAEILLSIIIYFALLALFKITAPKLPRFLFIPCKREKGKPASVIKASLRA